MRGVGAPPGSDKLSGRPGTIVRLGVFALDASAETWTAPEFAATGAAEAVAAGTSGHLELASIAGLFVVTAG
jgi:hypothetical protein